MLNFLSANSAIITGNPQQWCWGCDARREIGILGDLLAVHVVDITNKVVWHETTEGGIVGVDFWVEPFGEEVGLLVWGSIKSSIVLLGVDRTRAVARLNLGHQGLLLSL